MKIDAMSIIGFREMFEILESNEKNQIYTAMTGGLGPKGNELMNDIRVTTEISDLSILEAIHMRDFSSTFQITNTDRRFDISPDDNEMQAHLYELESLIKAIDTDDDIKYFDRFSTSELHILPIGVMRYDANVSFTGYGLQNILGMEAKKLFIREGHWLYDEGNIKEIIGKMLAQKFFETLSRKLTMIDKETEFYLQSKHFSPLRSAYGSQQRIVQLNEVVTPEASFSLKTNTQDEILRRCRTIKESILNQNVRKGPLMTKPKRDKDFVESFRLNFGVIMNVSEFLLLSLIYPEYIMNSENLSMQTRDRYIEIDLRIREKYTARLEGPISNILVERENSEDIFTNFNFIMGGQVIACNLSIPYMVKNLTKNDFHSSFQYEIIANPHRYVSENLMPFSFEFDKAAVMIVNIINSTGI